MSKQDTFLTMAHDVAHRMGVAIPPSDSQNPISVLSCVTREILKDVSENLVEDSNIKIRRESCPKEGIIFKGL